ncbi:MAG: hypothetical protein A2096_11400 [Spirochaetes bacterium GWF1_41_5]|nr:MAG: hypothetical protein A2096_11400 [Spirochaetes bacterium GWF1_41_5]HBE01641.1 hypothetical protein [Spirochaetia bacterium]
MKNKWKEKNRAKRRKIIDLNKRVRDLESSRDSFKDENERLRAEIDKLSKKNTEQTKIIESLNQQLKKTSQKISDFENDIKRYWYTMMLILNLLKMKLETSASFRAAAATAYIFELYNNENGKKLTHTTVLNWVLKLGYYQLTRPKEKANDWVILLDYSIQISSQKVFVVLGIRQSKIDFNRPLIFNDMEPLLISVKEKWNGEIICEEILKLQKQIGKIIYSVGDYGTDIKKGLILAKIPHVYDITHQIAAIIKNLYQKDERYIALTSTLATMRKQFLLSAYGYLAPNQQREKSRFANIKSVSEYGKNLINFLDNISAFKNSECFSKKELREAREKFSWIYEHDEIINELIMVNEAICSIQKTVKTYGLSQKTIKNCLKILQRLSMPKGVEMTEILKKYFKASLKLVKVKTILATSDILESAFGKYKNYISNNPMIGITNIVLSIAAFTSDLSKEIIKEALENTRIADVLEWSEENIGNTQFKKRLIAFSTP